MAGNVWEWVDEPYVQVTAGDRVMRGGSYDFTQDMAYRLVGGPNVPVMYDTAGMRCAADAVKEK
jgi:formylglycine-generating enzyme required for sulfatase activity